MALTKKQEAFAVAYIEDLNASDAYRRAYSPKTMSPKTINEAASRLLANSKVAARISELRLPALAEAEVTAEKTIREAARIGFNDPRPFFDDAGRLKLPNEWTDAMAAAVSSIKVTEEFEGKGENRKQVGFTREIKFWDKNASLEKLMKHLGLFERDNTQKGENLKVQILLVGPRE